MRNLLDKPAPAYESMGETNLEAWQNMLFSLLLAGVITEGENKKAKERIRKQLDKEGIQYQEKHHWEK